MQLTDRVPSARPRVLTLTSSPNLRRRLQQRLDMGCHVSHAPDGVTALLTLERHRIDLVILADDLPSLDAPTVARLLRQHAPMLPIVLLADRVRQAAACVDLCVPRPWDATQIADSVLVLLRCSPAHRPIAVPISRPDPVIEALVLELEAIEQMLERDQRVQSTRCIRQAIGQLSHTKRRLAALAGGLEL